MESNTQPQEKIYNNKNIGNRSKVIKSILTNSRKLKDVRSYVGVACYIVFGPVDGPVAHSITQDWIDHKVSSVKRKLQQKKKNRNKKNKQKL